MVTETTGELAYRLDTQAVGRRALAGMAISIVRSLAPIALAVVVLRRLRWVTPAPFWIVAGTLVALVVVRAVVGFGAARRRLGSLVVTLTDEAIGVRFTSARTGSGGAGDLPSRHAYAIERDNVARLSEIAGPLGGIIVESHPDARTGAVQVAQVPRGGAGYSAVRRRLEGWRVFERRGRRGPAARVAVFGLVVASIFFVPFLLDDFVAHSRLLGAMLIAGLLFVLRGAVRG